jgi:thiol-disulfide isomerase/thioredoxin|tara:strand:+ start:651 stop:1262 length:612 start_codon:yes stop_codon:yes gene_type:complete
MTALLHAKRTILIALAAGGLVVVALAVTAAMIYIDGDKGSHPVGDRPGTILLPQPFVMHETPRPLPVVTFEDGAGQALTLASFKGKTVLLNIWATWCVPCREEMPTLDALQAKLGGPGFEVVPLSVDRAGPEVVRKFYAEIGIRNLGLYIDASMRASFDLAAVGLPTTLLIDGEGRELGRLVGPAEWDAPEMIDFLRTHQTSN